MCPSIRPYEAITLAPLFTLLAIVYAQGAIEYNGISDQSYESDFVFSELPEQETKALDVRTVIENTGDDSSEVSEQHLENTRRKSNTEIPIASKEQLKSENNENGETSEDFADLIELLGRRMRKTRSSKNVHKEPQNLPRNIITKREVNDDEPSEQKSEEFASKNDPYIEQKRKEAKSRIIDIEKTFNDTTKSTGDMQVGILLFKDKITDMSQNSKKLSNCLSAI